LVVALANVPAAKLAGAASVSSRLVVVELYQSQGCSSCPPADAILNALADRRDILPLSFAVTYWDYLGWKDRYARAEYTKRQRDFANANGRSIVATPQFVVDGSSIVSGSDQTSLAAAIRGASSRQPGPPIAIGGGTIFIGAGKALRPATVWLVRYDPRQRLVSIDRGENSGRRLAHRNIVTGLRALGTWSGRPVRFTGPTYRDANQRSALLIQDGIGGKIIGAGRLQ
jgi:hypothetical protein